MAKEMEATKVNFAKFEFFLTKFLGRGRNERANRGGGHKRGARGG